MTDRPGATEATPAPDRPVVLRGGTVLTMDSAAAVLSDADVLVIDDAIAAVGPALDVPDGTQEVDARGGIVMPGMIDTHRHMWQTVMRGYGADWTLTQYFVWYYLEHGRSSGREDVAAGNRLAAWRPSRGRHDGGRLVARPADRRARRSRRGRPPLGARPFRARVREHPGRPVGVDG